MDILKQACNNVSEVTIQNCFKKVGFHPPRDIELLPDGESHEVDHRNIWSCMINEGIIPADFNFDDYVNTDEEINCREIITTDEIEVSLIPADDPEDVDDDDEPTIEPPPTIVEGTLMIRRIQHLLQCLDSDSVFVDYARQIENKLIDASIKKLSLKQSKVTDFFKKRN